MAVAVAVDREAAAEVVVFLEDRRNGRGGGAFCISLLL